MQVNNPRRPLPDVDIERLGLNLFTRDNAIASFQEYARNMMNNHDLDFIANPGSFDLNLTSLSSSIETKRRSIMLTDLRNIEPQLIGGSFLHDMWNYMISYCLPPTQPLRRRSNAPLPPRPDQLSDEEYQDVKKEFRSFLIAKGNIATEYARILLREGLPQPPPPRLEEASDGGDAMSTLSCALCSRAITRQ